MEEGEQRARILKFRVIAVAAGEIGDEICLLLLHIPAQMGQLVAHDGGLLVRAHGSVHIGFQSQGHIDPGDVQIAHPLAPPHELGGDVRAPQRGVGFLQLIKGAGGLLPALLPIGKMGGHGAVLLLRQLFAQAVCVPGQGDTQVVQLLGAARPHRKPALLGKGRAGVIDAAEGGIQKEQNAQKEKRGVDPPEEPGEAPPRVQDEAHGPVKKEEQKKQQEQIQADFAQRERNPRENGRNGGDNGPVGAHRPPGAKAGHLIREQEQKRPQQPEQQQKMALAVQKRPFHPFDPPFGKMMRIMGRKSAQT